MSLPEMDDKVVLRETFIDDLKSILKDIVDEQILSDNSDQSLLHRDIPERPFVVLHKIQQRKQLTENEKKLILLGFAFEDIAYLFLSKNLESEETSKDIILISPENTADFIKRSRNKRREYESRHYYYIPYEPDILIVDNTDKDNPNITTMYEVKTSRYKKDWEKSISKATWLQEKLPEIFGETDLFYVAPQERMVDLSGFLDEEKIIPVPIKIKALNEFAEKMLERVW